MKLTVLGCAGSFPGPDSPCSAYLVEAADFRLMLDFGTGSLSALQRHADLRGIDAVLLTHLHCDHIMDAASYVVVRRYAPDGPYPRLPLYAPEGVRARLAAVYGCPEEGPLENVYDFHTLRPGRFTLGPFAVTVERVNHPIETYGVRLEHDGHALTYSSDTAACAALTALASGVDVLLCEASYLDGCDNPPDIHMTGREAGETAAAAGVGRLLLTHMVSAWGNEAETYEAAAKAFHGPVTVVRSGDRYQV